MYAHQARALDVVRAGENPLIVTGTASGKSLCYVAPLLEMLLRDPRERALLLFPAPRRSARINAADSVRPCVLPGCTACRQWV